MGGQGHILEGIFKAIDKNYVKTDGEQAGELIGPKLQTNPYKLNYHLWYPFEKSVGSLKYRSFNEHEPTFDNLSSWFKDWLFSRFYQKAIAQDENDKIFAEGVVFYNLKRQAEGKIWMAKLRRDMFDWYYEGIKIINYNKKTELAVEDQEKFD